MSVQEIKDTLATLPRKDQDEVVAFLFQLRRAEESDYQDTVARRAQDTAPSHRLPPNDFEKQLDANSSK